ncbi:MAG: hypothetical protein MAGBODY4_00297 [Candidatus Marinimicrobia bacterium]|nr:hypothetical protein [Candidatus Neomarinimicrobiota bacterium]
MRDCGATSRGGGAYAGRPSLQIHLRDIGREVEPKRPGLSLPFYRIPSLFAKQIQRLSIIQVHAVTFSAQGEILRAGDPLSQLAVYPLLTSLLSDIENRVILPVNNQTDISRVDPRTNIVLMPVTPSQGNVNLNYWANLNYLSEDGEILFQLEEPRDYQWMKRIITRNHLAERFTAHLLVEGEMELRKRWLKQIIKDGLGVHLLPPVPFTPLPVHVDQSFRQPRT